MDRTGYVRIDADYLLQVRPHLTDREARVYEAVILLCDGWDRPTTSSAIGSITKLHIDHVRKALRSLEQLNLIGCAWEGSRTNPNGHRSVTILRDYPATVRALRALGRIGPELPRAMGRNSPESPRALDRIGPELPPATLGRIGPELPRAMGRNSPKTLGRNSPETLGQIGLEHLTRSDPDPSILPSLPSQPRAVPSLPPANAGGEAHSDVPEELVALCRELWSANEVPVRAAERFVARLLPIGSPAASVAEIERYLRTMAKTHRVNTAGCPIAVACMPDEFDAWLERHRKGRRQQVAHGSPADRREPTSPEPDTPLSAEEMGRRAAAVIARLEGGRPHDPHPAERKARPREAQPEVNADVGT